MGEQILSDIKVLDLTWYIAGAYCTKIFADYGAEVIKVERPGEGDPARMMKPFLNDDPHPDKSLLFSHLNLNKLGITLSLKTGQGMEILKELIKNADILVENFSPGTMENLGLGYESVEKINPKLIMTSISNFGQTGPYRDYKLSELVLNGFHSMYNSGQPDRFPIKMGGNICLYQGGFIAALATMGAHWAAEEQNIGQYLDISLMETIAGDVDRKTVDMLSWAYSEQGIYTYRRDAAELAVKHIMPAGTFPCQDGFIASLPILPHWPRFVELMKNPEVDKIRFPEDIMDLDIKGEIDVLWYDWLAERTKRQVMEEGQAVKWFATAINTPEDAVNDPHFQEHGFWVEAEHPVTGKQTYPGAPVKIDEDSWKIRRTAPTLGQHNQEIYARIGYGPDEVENLHTNGVI